MLYPLRDRRVLARNVGPCYTFRTTSAGEKP
jgi:hypothetical protein